MRNVRGAKLLRRAHSPMMIGQWLTGVEVFNG
jgi:hypothetical protein